LKFNFFSFLIKFPIIICFRIILSTKKSCFVIPSLNITFVKKKRRNMFKICNFCDTHNVFDKDSYIFMTCNLCSSEQCNSLKKKFFNYFSTVRFQHPSFCITFCVTQIWSPMVIERNVQALIGIVIHLDTMIFHWIIAIWKY